MPGHQLPIIDNQFSRFIVATSAYDTSSPALAKDPDGPIKSSGCITINRVPSFEELCPTRVLAFGSRHSEETPGALQKILHGDKSYIPIPALMRISDLTSSGGPLECDSSQNLIFRVALIWIDELAKPGVPFLMPWDEASCISWYEWWGPLETKSRWYNLVLITLW